MADFDKQLSAFVAHYEMLNAKGEDAEDGYNQEFMSLKAESQQYKDQNMFPTESGQLPQNKKKNRFKDILPFEYTRVQLHKIEGVEGSDYVNANYIQGADGNVTYIAAQGPLPQTVNDFWRMIWYHQIEIMVMACREVENGKNKCQCYWPPVQESQYYGAIKVTTHHEESISNDFIVRELMAECQGEEQVVRQYHYTAWPDHGRPPSPIPIIRMLEMISDHRKRHDIPIVVHCSAGCGRTGTIIAIDFARTILLNKDTSLEFSVYNIVHEMRKQRPAMVQAKDQYVFVYLALMELTRRIVENVPQAPPKLFNFEKKPSPPTIKTTPSESSGIYSNINYDTEGTRDETSSNESTGEDVRKAKLSPTLHPKPLPRSSNSKLNSETTKPAPPTVKPAPPTVKPAPPTVKPKPDVAAKPSRPNPVPRKTSGDPVPTPRKSPVPPKDPEVPTYINVPQDTSTPVPKERKQDLPNTSSTNISSTSGRSIVEFLMNEVGDVLPPEDYKEVSGGAEPPSDKPVSDSSYALLNAVSPEELPPDIPTRTVASTQLLVTEVPSVPVYETPDKDLIKHTATLPIAKDPLSHAHSHNTAPPNALKKLGKKKDKPADTSTAKPNVSPVKNTPVATPVAAVRSDRFRFPGEMGFGVRVGKPRGPRNIPSHWNVPNGLTLHY